MIDNITLDGATFFYSNFTSGAKLIGAGLATIGVAGPGMGAGVIFSGFISSVARNPFMKQQLFVFTILGFALTEALALFALMMAFLILFAF
jgi:F-type H+-transporting ATPase subunit c